MGKSEWVCGLAYLCVLGALPLAGNWFRQGQNSFCAHNGGVIEPLYGVRIVEGDQTFRFCCIDCAKNWLGNRNTNQGDRLGSSPLKHQIVFVVDEVSGTEINAADAYFVRSLTITNRLTGNRIHAFRNKNDADLHAGSPGSDLLGPGEGPFAKQVQSTCPHCNPK